MSDKETIQNYVDKNVASWVRNAINNSKRLKKGGREQVMSVTKDMFMYMFSTDDVKKYPNMLKTCIKENQLFKDMMFKVSANNCEIMFINIADNFKIQLVKR